MRIPTLAMIAAIALPVPAMAQVAREPVEQKVPAPGATATPADDRTPAATEARSHVRAAPGEAVPTGEAPASRPPVDQPEPATDDPTRR